jgi:hypothetical protein
MLGWIAAYSEEHQTVFPSVDAIQRRALDFDRAMREIDDLT